MKIANGFLLLSVSLYTLKTRILGVYLQIWAFSKQYLLRKREQSMLIQFPFISWSYPIKIWGSIG